MKLIHVGAAMLNTIPLAWDHNLDLITTALERARDRRVSLLCLPELCITGYGCEDAFYSPGVQRTALEVLHEIAPRTRGLIATVGLPLAYRKALFDAVAVLVDGHIAGFVAKRHLAGDGIYYEPRWFRPWPAATRVEVDLAADDARADVEGLSGDAASYPLGDLVFTCDGVRIGFEICEDAWVAERPGAALAARGVDVLLNPSASHFAFGKAAIRERFVLEGSRAFGVSYVYANLVGNEAGRAIYDGGALIASAGRMLAAGPRFSYADVRLTTAVIDVDETRMLQTRTSSYMPRIEPDPDGEIEVPFRFPTLRDAAEVETVAAAAPGAPGAPLPADGAPPPVVSPYAHGPRAKEEEFTRAVALGLIDYLRKSRSHGFVVSLSGGADSAATACLVALAVRLGAAELGLQRLLTKIDYIDRLAAAGTPDEVLRHLLICAYQATRNSGPVTRAAAAGLAEALGATHHELDVDALVDGYTERVEDALGRTLTWDRDDVALQNIQSRTRAPGIWMLANLRGALLLSTSNRSEAAVGYTTMDGDTSGGLSPLSGIDKAFLLRWLRWLEVEGPAETGPIPALAAINAQQPTAELRPPGEAQTDEADLMPYDVLEAIERAAIRDKQMPVEVYRALRPRFADAASARQLAAWIERFFQLWCRNQWKRERYAPSFHLDDENLDPKTWCRFPILSGGFAREIRTLWAYVDGDEPASATASGTGERTLPVPVWER